MQGHRSYSNKGVSVVELLIVIAILGIAFSSLLNFSSSSIRAALLMSQSTQAQFLAQEAIEAIKNYRDGTVWDNDDPADQYDGLGQLQTGIPFHLILSGDTPPKWQVASGAESIGIFQRSLTVQTSQRNGSDEIVQSGGTDDPNTKNILVSISWTERGASHEITAQTLLTNWRQ